MENKTLANCRETSRLLKACIDDINLLWLQIVYVPKILKKGYTYLYLATKTGQKDMFELIIEIEEVNKSEDPLFQAGG